MSNFKFEFIIGYQSSKQQNKKSLQFSNSSKNGIYVRMTTFIPTNQSPKMREPFILCLSDGLRSPKWIGRWLTQHLLEDFFLLIKVGSQYEEKIPYEKSSEK
jgi:hypothetical protein